MRVSLLFLFALVGRVLPAQTRDTSLRAYPAPTGIPSRLVHVEYDSQHDKTVVQLGPVALDSTLGMTALVALDGRTVTKEASGVVLTFWSTAPERPLATDRSIILSLGAADFDLGAAWLTPQPPPGYTDVGMKSVPLGLWLALAAVDTASIRVGARTFPLTAETRAAVRAFASHMAPRGALR